MPSGSSSVRGVCWPTRTGRPPRRPQHHVVGSRGRRLGDTQPPELREHPLVRGVEREDHRLHERGREPAVRLQRSCADARERSRRGRGPHVAPDLEAGRPDLLEQDRRLVPPNVTAGVVERGPEAGVHRGREDQHPARSADPGHLGEQTGVVVDVLDHLEGEHRIEGVLRERQGDTGSRCRGPAGRETAQRVGRGVDERRGGDRRGRPEPGADLEHRAGADPGSDPVPHVRSHLHHMPRPAPMVLVVFLHSRRSARSLR